MVPSKPITGLEFMELPVAKVHKVDPVEDLSAYKLFPEAIYSDPSDLNATDVRMVPSGRETFHLSAPVEAVMAYKLSDPTYKTPSEPKVGLFCTENPVKYFHFKVPEGFRA